MARQKEEWQGCYLASHSMCAPVVWASGAPCSSAAVQPCSSLLRQYAEASYTVDVSSVEGLR